MVDGASMVDAAQLSRKVKQLEKKVATLSVLNGALKDENDELKDTLRRQPQGRGTSGGSGGNKYKEEVEELKEEFGERLAQIENKLLDVTSERDELSLDLHSCEEKLADRDETISALQSEGDDLARKNGELESRNRKLKGSLREETAEKERLRDQVDQLKKDFRKENSSVSGSGDKFRVLSEELEQERSKYASMSEKLKKEYEAKVEEQREQLEEQSRSECIILREREYKLVEQVQRLQDSLVELEGSSAEREDNIRKENRFLEHKCQQLDSKLAEMSNSYTEQSKPYLEEIEHLREEALKQQEQADAIAIEFRTRVADRDKQIRVLEGKLLASETIAMSTEEVVIKLKETVVDTNRQLDQQHERVLAALRKAATRENEVKVLKEREQSLLQEIDRKQVDFEERLRGKSSEMRHLEERYQGMIKSNGETISKQKEELNTLHGSEEELEEESNSEAMGLEALLQDSKVKLNWGLLQGQRDESGEVRSLKEQLAQAEVFRNEAVHRAVQIEKDHSDLKKRYDTAVVLIGESEEKVEQLEDDIREMKHIFHEQINIMADQLQEAKSAS